MQRIVKLSLGAIAAVAIGGVLGSFATSGMVLPTPIVPYTRPPAATPSPPVEPYSYPISAAPSVDGAQALKATTDCAGVEGLDAHCTPIQLHAPRLTKSRAVAQEAPPEPTTPSLADAPPPVTPPLDDPFPHDYRRDMASADVTDTTINADQPESLPQ